MTQIKETVGRLPIYIGEYDSNKTYKKKNRVTLFGSEFQSLIDNNTYAPATLSADETHIIFDEVHWKVISNGSDAFLNHQTVLEKLDEIDSKQNSMQSEINGKQLEIGAVQTDVVPKQGSANHMTSGAIYETLKNPASGFVKNTTPEEEGDKLVNEALVAGMYGFYTENPEWIWVVLDSQKHVLGGFKTDGEFEFSKGVPTPIREYIAAQLESFVTEISNKVDKEEGKGLIIVDFADGVSYEENPEWVFVQLDAEGKVLSGIRNDGTNFIPKLEVGEFVNLDKLITKFGNSYYNVSLNHTELESKVYYHPNTNWKQVEYDSSAYPYDETDTYNVGEICNVEDDTEHSYESTVRQRGNYPAYTTTTLHVTEKLDLAQALEKIPSDTLSGFVAGQVITFVDNDDVVERWELQNDETWSQVNPSTINDAEERLSMELDREDKILSYRKKDGTLVENAGIETTNIKTNHLELKEQGMNDFQQALRDAGFDPTDKNDWSKSEFVEIPIPRICAIVNILSEYPLPINDESIDGYLEFWDKDGNYFKKKITGLEVQGDSSKVMPEKNYKFDFDDGSTIKFGKLVPQDSFHLKKYYIDNFRGQCVVAYRLAEQMYQTRAFGNRKPFEYLYTNHSSQDGRGKISEDFNTGALCHPEGFPVKLFFNNKIVGIYSFNLKKHRDNYAMNKKNTNHIILDGGITYNSLFGGNINWEAFEIRNPKPKLSKDGWQLVDINGVSYDGDNPKELMGSDTPGYDESNQSHKKSAITKSVIERLSKAVDLIRSELPSNSDDTATKEQKLSNARQVFETYFKKDEVIDYFIYGNVIYDCDGFAKNWIWCTWDGLLWSPTYYDKDSIFGLIPATGLGIEYQSLTRVITRNTTDNPAGLAQILYKDEIEARYKELRDCGVYTTSNIVSLLEDWVSTVGYDNLKEELEDTCPETPSYRSNNLYSGWKMQKLEDKSLPEFDPDKTYQAGDRCWYRYMTIEATKEIPPHPSPIETPYSLYPEGGGFHNSIMRVHNWLQERLTMLDSVFNYS